MCQTRNKEMAIVGPCLKWLLIFSACISKWNRPCPLRTEEIIIAPFPITLKKWKKNTSIDAPSPAGLLVLFYIKLHRIICLYRQTVINDGWKCYITHYPFWKRLANGLGFISLDKMSGKSESRTMSGEKIPSHHTVQCLVRIQNVQWRTEGSKKFRIHWWESDTETDRQCAS